MTPTGRLESSPSAGLPWRESDLGATVSARLESVVEASPSAVAIASGGKSWTYRELKGASDACASALLGLRLPLGQVVAVFLPSGFNNIAAYLGILKAGHIALPLDVRAPRRRVASILGAMQPALGLVEAATAHTFHSTGARLATMEYGSWRPDPETTTVPAIPVDHPASVYVTSGSTGTPKGVVRSHRVMLHHAMVYSQDHGIGPQDRQSYLYSSQSGASMPDLLGALLNGAVLCPWDARGNGVHELAEWINAEHISLLHMPIGLLRLMLQSLETDRTFPSLRVVIAGGEPAFPHDVRAARRHVPESCVFVHQLAATETNYMARNFLRADSPLPEGVLPVGMPARDKRLLLVNERGEEVPPGEVGEIVVESSFLASGYWRDPGLTNRKFKPVRGSTGEHRYFTGDLGQWTPDGLRHMGRVDEQVRVRGHRVELAEVERALQDWNVTGHVAVVAPSDDQGGRRLVAYLVPVDRRRPPTPEAMRAFLADRLPEYMVPSALVVMEELPLLATGKIDRRALPQMRGSRPGLRTPFEEPRDLYEERLVRIWEAVLGIRPIGVRDSFFDLGGTSLQAMQLTSRVSRDFGELLPQASLLQASTVEKLALLLKSEQTDRPTARIVGIQSEGNRVPFFCISPRVVDVLAYRTLALTLGEAQPFYALYSVDMPPKPASLSMIEHQAAIFIGDIEATAPEGPIAVGGYSHGGIVAQEVARQLAAQGRDVALLVLMDVYGPDYRRMVPPLPTTAYRPLQVLRSAERRIVELLPWLCHHLRTLGRLQWPDRWVYLGGKASNHLRWLARNAQRTLGGGRKSPRPTGPGLPRAVGKSFIDFRPGSYAGRTIIFRARRQPLGIRSDPKMGWGEVLRGETSVVEIPGYHDSILFGPRISILAGELGRRLDRLQPGDAPPGPDTN